MSADKKPFDMLEGLAPEARATLLALEASVKAKAKLEEREPLFGYLARIESSIKAKPGYDTQDTDRIVEAIHQKSNIVTGVLTNTAESLKVAMGQMIGLQTV